MNKTRNFLLACALAASASAHAADPTPPDNTGKNERDRSGETLTAQDQSNDPKDIKLAADTRKAVVADDSLSLTAKNCKIIAVDGAITLRGPVNSPEEKAKVAEYATKAGATKVTNALEVKSSD